MQDNEILETKTEQNEAVHETSTTSIPKQNKVESKNDFTYEDLINDLAKTSKNKEVIEELKSNYLKHLPTSISKNKVESTKGSLIDEMIEISARHKAEKIALEKLEQLKQEQNLEVKSFFEKNNLSEITEEELKEMLDYNVISSNEDFEKIKNNPILAKHTKEALEVAKIKSKPLPKSNQNQSATITEEEFNKIKMKIFSRKPVSTTERELFNSHTKHYIK